METRPGKPLELEPDPFSEGDPRFRNPNVIDKQYEVNFNGNPGCEDPEVLKGFRVVKSNFD
ncbi:MAG: hypothetical protein EOM25_04340 [Deltaproteobacteria bacterium]|nr:hypothetical protein [Deltaproteobacteria bacterium]